MAPTMQWILGKVLWRGWCHMNLYQWQALNLQPAEVNLQTTVQELTNTKLFLDFLSCYSQIL